MPQVWLTYAEFAAFAGRSAEEARAFAHAEGWDLRRCHDGFTRLKLPLAYLPDYAARLAAHLAPRRDAEAAAAGAPMTGPQAERVAWLAERLSEAGLGVRTETEADADHPETTPSSGIHRAA